VGEREGLMGFAVDVQSIDHNLPYRYPSRTLKITTPSGSFETPLRAATHYEYRSRIRMTAKATIDTPVAVNSRKMNCNQLISFLNNNQSFEPLLRRIELFRHISQYASLRLALVQPTTTSDPEDRLPPAMSVLQNDAMLRDRFLRFLVKLQQDAGLNQITVPFLELPFTDLRSIIIDLHKSITSMNLEPVFFVDLRQQEQDFKSLIELLTDTLESKLVGLIYRRWYQAPVNYDFLSQTYCDRDVAFLCAHVDRYDVRFDDVSTPHFLPFYGADIYAVQAPPPFHDERNIGSQQGTQQETSRLDKIRFFDRGNLKVKPISSTLFDPATILADMKLEDRQYSKEILENRQEANNDQEKYLTLNSLSKFHELLSSTREFQDVRKYIGEGSARVYVQGRVSLEPALAPIRK
jgi:hypothetical protein